MSSLDGSIHDSTSLLTSYVQALCWALTTQREPEQEDRHEIITVCGTVSAGMDKILGEFGAHACRLRNQQRGLHQTQELGLQLKEVGDGGLLIEGE